MRKSTFCQHHSKNLLGQIHESLVRFLGRKVIFVNTQQFAIHVSFVDCKPYPTGTPKRCREKLLPGKSGETPRPQHPATHLSTASFWGSPFFPFPEVSANCLYHCRTNDKACRTRIVIFVSTMMFFSNLIMVHSLKYIYNT